MSEAQKFEGKWVLEDTEKDEVPVLVVIATGCGFCGVFMMMTLCVFFHPHLILQVRH